jgi:integrase
MAGDCPLPGQPGEARFHRAYVEKLALVERLSARSAPAQGTFAWIISKYRASAQFDALANATQADYEKTLTLIGHEHGPDPFEHMTRSMVKTVRDDYASTPRKANKITQMISRLYSWADEAELIAPNTNATRGLKRLRRKGGEREITVWSDEEIDLFLSVAPLHVRTCVLQALFTGQRAGDIATMTWGQYQKSIIRVRQWKTGEALMIPCHPTLQEHLDGLKRASVVICTNAKGKPISGGAIAGAIARVIEKAPGMPKRRSIHGLRYAAGSRMA